MEPVKIEGLEIKQNKIFRLRRRLHQRQLPKRRKSVCRLKQKTREALGQTLRPSNYGFQPDRRRRQSDGMCLRRER